MSEKVYQAPSPIHGNGLFAKIPLKQKTFIGSILPCNISNIPSEDNTIYSLPLFFPENVCKNQTWCILEDTPRKARDVIHFFPTTQKYAHFSNMHYLMQANDQAF